MFNVLKAFSIYDKKVGYCQGMSFICAVFLLYFSEEETFAVLCRLIKDYELSGLFEPGFPTLRKCLYIHDQLLEFWLPRLSAHFVCTFFSIFLRSFFNFVTESTRCGNQYVRIRLVQHVICQFTLICVYCENF